ncbi:MAG: alpha/beta hydrolase fold domain-containing protein [Rhodospirillaceae bacterium]|nr:alpha/beta hydrolase fold domain-containing protein [Rhodospirillaceae bacterium]MDE0000859.1 alpha/beta hydrolase fold domain-containing protein [Rhodospirillaceae bacterium]MDE0361278.1 alpha/beta hydrolase fold domain-containing protein [Rhodospirillaceae bacterium]
MLRKTPWIVLPAAFALGASLPMTASSEGAFLRNLHTLDDESRGYCLDIVGAGENINREAPLGTRTCKYERNYVDQLFEWGAPDKLYAPEYDLCVAADTIDEGGQLFVQDCSDAAEQSWTLTPNGRLSPVSRPDLCVTLNAERGLANSPVWLAMVYHGRTVSLVPCADSAAALQQLRWALTDEQKRRDADQVGDSMPADLAAAIRRVTEQGGAAAETSELYADRPRTYDLDEIEVVSNIAYGPHERNLLDVHTDTRRNDDDPKPVVMYFHGGGFVRGNKDGNRNVADYFASLGLVGVNATYRLVPEAKWPDGANDVGNAVAWVKDNIAGYGGDPEKIFVIGKSAAAAHAATYVFRPEVLEPGIPAAAGVILISGGYGADTDRASGARLDYFGEDLSRWPHISTINNVERTDIPVMFTISEFDNPGTEESMVQLVAEVTAKSGSMPRVVQLISHNHYSPNPSIGTQDTQVSAAILQFVRSIALGPPEAGAP